MKDLYRFLLDPLHFYGCMKKLNKELLRKQMDVFLSWTTRNNIGSFGYGEWLDLFCKHTHRTDVLDITEADIDLFFEKVDNEENAVFRKMAARTAILSFQRYYMARSKNGKTRLGKGRPYKIEGVEKVRELRALKDPLSFRAIARALETDVGQVYKWFKYGLRKTK